jgi:hypothetical protein
MVEGIQQKLPKNFYDPLVENLVEEKSFTEQVKAISQAFAMVNNPLVIMELKRNSTEGMKAPITAILIDHDALQDKDLTFWKLFLEGNFGGKHIKSQKQRILR